MRIFHLALASEWEAARETGSYTTSTLGRSLREEGFIHASHADQWQQVRQERYAEVTEPLVLLSIDTDLLTAPVVEEGGFPHIYGALDVDAVVRVLPLGGEAPEAAPEGTGAPATVGAGEAPEAGHRPKTFMQLFVEEMAFRAMLGFCVMVFAGVLGFIAQQRYGDGVALAVTLVALGLAGVVAFTLARRRDARLRPAQDA